MNRLIIFVVSFSLLLSFGCTKNIYITEGQQADLEEAASEADFVLETDVASTKLVRLDGEELALDSAPLPLRMDIVVEFAEAIDDGTRPKVEEAFKVSPEEGEAVEGEFEWNSEGKILTFKPQENFDYQTEYVIDITGTVGSFTTMVDGDIDGNGVADVVSGAPGQGKVYIYNSVNSSSPSYSVYVESPSIGFGRSLAIVGDINADGYADMAVGDPLYSSGRGKVYIMSGWLVAKGDSTYLATIQGEKEGSAMGMSVSGVGDVNNDGYWDLLVGASQYGSDELSSQNQGKAYLYDGKKFSEGDKTIMKSWMGEHVLSELGTNIASAGDITGDGLPEFAITEVGPNPKVSIYSYDNLDEPIAEIPGFPGSLFGKTITPAGDLDGDGKGDLLIGDYAFSSHRGRVHLYNAKTILGEDSSQPKMITGESDWDMFGKSSAVMGEGPDALILVGAPKHAVTSGIVYAFRASDLVAGENDIGSNLWTKSYDVPDDKFGDAMARIGDVTGDKVDDLIIGSPKTPVCADPKGSAMIFSGTDLAGPAAYTLSPGVNGDRFGISVSGLSP